MTGMKRLVPVIVCIAMVGCGTRAKVEADRTAPVHSAHNNKVCLLAGAPPSDVKVVALGRIKATKRTYGGTDELLPVMAREARKLGADAIINLQAEQRFKGPLPWRVTSPTGDGIAVKVLPDSPKLDCLGAGGRLA